MTTAVDGTADAVLHPLSVQPTAVGWSRTRERGVLCLATANDVLLVDDGDPGRTLGTLSHPAPVIRMWSSVRAGLVAVADARGGVTVHDLTATPTVGRGRRQQDPEGGVTALCGDPWSGAVVWGSADGRVYGVGAGDAALLGTLPGPATSLALLSDAGLVVAADGGDRLLRLAWPGGGSVTAVPMPFRVREVHPATGGLLLVSGHGGEVEIRAEDGRTHLLTPGPVPSPPDEAGPGWLRDSVGVVLPARDAVLPTGIRRWGIGHVCLPASLPPDSEEFAMLLARAREQGLRVLAELAPPGKDSAHGELLRRAYDLLEETVDGLRLSDTVRWPASLLTRMRHLLEAYPQAAVVTTSTPRIALGTGHVTLDPPPELVVTDGEDALQGRPAPDDESSTGGNTGAEADTGISRTAQLSSYGTWFLPDRLPLPQAGLLLALPGCHEVPASVLDPADQASSALRPCSRPEPDNWPCVTAGSSGCPPAWFR